MIEFFLRFQAWIGALILNLLLGTSLLSLGAQEFKVKAKTQENEVVFYAKNDNYCPYQLELKINNKEALSDQGRYPSYFEVPAQVDSFFLFRAGLNQENTTLKYRYAYTLGSPDSSQTIDPDYPYLLPFPEGKRHFVTQGYDGKFSHQNQFALDFKMKEGSSVHAAREGVVVRVKDDSEVGGKTSDFADKANQIIVYHSDGSFAYYWHLAPQGALVALGDRVKAGQKIGLSGNTGWSTRPHLHFVVKKSVRGTLKSIPIKFYYRKEQLKSPKAWRFYKAFYPEDWKKLDDL